MDKKVLIILVVVLIALFWWWFLVFNSINSWEENNRSETENVKDEKKDKWFSEQTNNRWSVDDNKNAWNSKNNNNENKWEISNELGNWYWEPNDEEIVTTDKSNDYIEEIINMNNENNNNNTEEKRTCLFEEWNIVPLDCAIDKSLNDLDMGICENYLEWNETVKCLNEVTNTIVSEILIKVKNWWDKSLCEKITVDEFKEKCLWIK